MSRNMPLPTCSLSRGGFMGVALSLVQVARSANNSLTSVKPLALSPSQYWDGNDGPWSSFGVEVGTPSQQLRLLPATGVNLPWVVLPEGCISSDPPDCGRSRGFLFKRNVSSTWEYKGGAQNKSIYMIGINQEQMLEYSNQGPYSGNAYYGYDTMNLGWPGHSLPSIANQTIAGIATKDFHVGSLGINPQKINFTDLNNPLPSMLHNLKDNGYIPTLSWGYTAGAYNYIPRTYGSLTLGGYDSTRFVPNNLTIPFGADTSRDLLPFVQSITVNATSNSNLTLLSNGIYAFIDSLVPYIWLPRDACAAFEEAFRLHWNDTLNLYLVNDSLHTTLLSENPSVIFKIGANRTSESTEIVMPYWAFDLTAGSALLDSADRTARYFPLKRADNDMQLTLGRAFLQSAYVIADYERGNFSISQALYPAPSVAQNLVAILPTDLKQTPATSSSGGLGPGAIGGISVGVVIVLVGLVGSFIYRRKRRNQQISNGDDFNTNAEAKDYTEMEATDNARYELGGGSAAIVEVDGQRDATETRTSVHEMFTRDTHQSGPVYEMPAEKGVCLPELQGN